jgi:RNA polymerase sigma-70 factor (ECF subfamily)
MTGDTGHPPPYAAWADASLVDAATAGDDDALDALLRRHHPRIQGICLRLTGNRADADDACQEALLALVRGLNRFDGRSTFATWAYRVTTNTCLDELRRRRRRPIPGLPDDLGRSGPVTGGTGLGGDPGPSGPVSGDHGGTVADRLDIDAALARLAPEFRVAVVLRDLCGLSYAEIAEVIDVPVGTVRSRIARGRALLLPHLAGSTGNPAAAPQRRTP